MRNDSSMAALRCLRCRVQLGETVLDIVLDRQVGKQSQVLKHIAHSAELRRKVDSKRAVEEDFSLRLRFGLHPVGQTSNAIEQRGLACPRGTKQDSDSRRKGDGEVKFEILSQRLRSCTETSARIRRRRFCNRVTG